MKTLFALLALSLGACAATIGVDFVASGDEGKNLSPRSPADVKLFLGREEPRCKYRIVGAYETRQDGGVFGAENSEALRLVREDAARRGFDGLMDYGCAPPGTVGYRQAACSGKAYVCE